MAAEPASADLPLHSRYAMHIAAVCSEVAIKAYPCSMIYQSVYNWPNQLRFGKDIADGIIVWDEHTVVIAISGTKNLEDWLKNIRVSGFSQGSMEISHGPWEYTLSAMRDLLETLALKRYNPAVGRNVIFCGHSLGGCAAMVGWLAIRLLLADTEMRDRLGFDMAAADFIPNRIITYGAPRCVSGKSAALFPWPVLQIRLCHDMVPSLPFTVRFGRAHVGRTVWIRYDGELYGSAPTFQYLRSFARWINKLALGRGIRENHAIGLYARVLSKFLTQPDWETAVLKGQK